MAQRCAVLHVPDPRRQYDSLIATTALVHRLIVITRKARDFEPMGVQFLNPWNPGIGPITPSAIATSVPDGTLFRSRRQFAAWLALTPKAHSSGGKERQVGISKQGDGYLRRLLVVCATAVMRLARKDNISRMRQSDGQLPDSIEDGEISAILGGWPRPGTRLGEAKLAGGPAHVPLAGRRAIQLARHPASPRSAKSSSTS